MIESTKLSMKIRVLTGICSLGGFGIFWEDSMSGVNTGSYWVLKVMSSMILAIKESNFSIWGFSEMGSFEVLETSTEGKVSTIVCDCWERS